MKILFLSCHSTLEYDEVKLFTELGHEVFSLHGSYHNPNTPSDPKRPLIKGPIHQQLMDVAAQCSKDDIHPELIEWADVIYVMHIGKWIVNNWSKIKHKVVIWRTIGQSVPQNENELGLFRAEGLKIVRYSPLESGIKGFLGEDAVIRFYKDPDEFKDWNGKDESVMNVTQSMKKRGLFCGYDIFNEVTAGLNRYVFGPGNDDIDYWGGEKPYEELIEEYKKHRVYFYTGTYPASYTLNFIEAFMTGIPIVAIGDSLAYLNIYDIHAYEVTQIIKNGVNGFVSEDKKELRGYIEELLHNPELAKQIGDEGRKTAIELFGKSVIIEKWRSFFNKL